MDEESSIDVNKAKSKKNNVLFKVATWLLTCLCFYLVLSKTQATAAREGITLMEYLVRFFGEAPWASWKKSGILVFPELGNTNTHTTPYSSYQMVASS